MIGKDQIQMICALRPPGKSLILGLALGTSLVLSPTACQDSRTEERGLLEEDSLPSLLAADSPDFVDREFWLALAEEPLLHLSAARDRFLGGEHNLASMELVKVAAILHFESRHAHSSEEERLLMSSVTELREGARRLRRTEDLWVSPISLEEMDEVATRALRSIAAHQISLSRDALNSGDGRVAGALLRESSRALAAGFQLSRVDGDPALNQGLEAARKMGLTMQVQGNGSHREMAAALDQMDSIVTALGRVVTGRRR